MKRIFRYSSVVFLIAALTISCEKNIDIDIDEIDSMIVLNGVLREGNGVTIYLSRTRHILDNMQISALTDATVEITDEDGNTVPLTYGENQLYRAEAMTIEAGKQYTVSASAEGYESVSATTMIPEAVTMVKLDTLSSVDEWGEKMIDFTVVFDDPAGVENYYMLSVRSDYQVSYIDYSYYLDTLYVDLEKDTVVMGYRRDSVEYIEIRKDNVWFESENLAIENEDNFSNRIIFSDRLFDGKRYSLTGRFYTWFLYEAKDSATIHIDLQTIDSHYYKYIDSRTDHYYAKNDPFAVPVVVHNNIESGVGILGAMAVDSDSITLPALSYRWEYPIIVDNISEN